MSSGLILPGAAGANATTPDNAALDVVGDLDLRADVTMPDWAPGTYRTVVSKWNEVATNNRSYLLQVTDKGLLQLAWSNDGTAVLSAASIRVPAAKGQRLAIRAAIDVDNGAAGRTISFYTAPTIDGPWTLLGTPVVQGTVTSIFNSNAVAEVSGHSASAAIAADAAPYVVHSVEIRDGIDGTVVAKPLFWQQPTGTTSFNDAAGRTWTVNSSAAGVASIKHGTPSYDLQYQLASDKPCDADTSWCAIRDKIAAEFAVNEKILGRTSPARPCAILTLTVPVTMPALNPAAALLPVTFDTIEFDNDRMVDFDRSQQFIKPRHPGAYCIVGWASVGPGTFNEELQMYIMTGPSGPDVLSPGGGSSSGFAQDAITVGGTPQYPKVEATSLYDQSRIDDVRDFGYGLLFDGGTTTAIALNAVRLCVFWRRDTP